MIQTLTIGTVVLSAAGTTGYLLGDHEGFDFPKVRVDIKDRGLYHGARLGQYNYGRRVFTIHGQIVGSSEADFELKRRAFEQALDLDNGLTTLYIATKAGLSLQASVIASSEPGIPYKKGSNLVCDFQIMLTAPFPYILSAVAISTTLNIFSGGGTPFPAAFPMSFATGGTGATTITNNGNAKSFPIVTITGPIANPSLQNATTGLQLSINYTLNTSTDKIVLDFYNHTAIVNGITNILQYISGDFWTVAPGANMIKLTAAANNNIAHAALSSFDAYLGI